MKFSLRSIFILLVVVPLVAIAEDNPDHYQPRYSTILDTAAARQFVHNSPRPLPQRITGYWTPTKKDIDKLQKNLRKLSEVTATGSHMQGSEIPIGLNNYALQYIGLIVNKRKYIYINALYLSDMIFIEDYQDWETKAITWKTGGYSYWGVLFNVKKAEFSDLYFNNR